MMFTSWSIFSQAFSFAFYPVLTRLYDPAQIGSLGIFMSMIAFLYALAPFQTDQLILNSLDEAETRRDSSTVIYISLLISLLFWLGILTAKLCDLPTLHTLPWFTFFLFPLFAIPTALSRITTTIALREKKFFTLGVSTGIPQVIAILLKVSFGFFHPVLLSLMLAELIYYWSILLLSTLQIRNLLRPLLPLAPVKDAWATLKQHRAVLALAQTAVLVNSLNIFLNIQYVALLFTPTDVGLFTFGWGLIFALSKNLTGSITYALTPRFAQHHREGSHAAALSVFSRAISKTFFLNVGLTIAVGFAAPVTFGLLFGKKWHLAGEVVPGLMLAFMAAGLSQPCTSVLRISLKPKLTIAYEVSQLIAMAGLVLWAKKIHFELTEYAWLLGGLQLALAILFTFFTYRLLRAQSAVVQP